MTNLREFEGKNIKLIDVENDTFEGYVGDYIFPDDNEPEGVEGIILDYPIRSDGYKYQNPVQFNAPEIRSIEVLF